MQRVLAIGLLINSKKHFTGKMERAGWYPSINATNAMAELQPYGEDDVKAIFAYLKSTKPINNVEPPIKPFSSLP
jgi:hypothetical protein